MNVEESKVERYPRDAMRELEQYSGDAQFMEEIMRFIGGSTE
jgi:hypothetical protein